MGRNSALLNLYIRTKSIKGVLALSHPEEIFYKKNCLPAPSDCITTMDMILGIPYRFCRKIIVFFSKKL